MKLNKIKWNETKRNEINWNEIKWNYSFLRNFIELSQLAQVKLEASLRGIYKLPNNHAILWQKKLRNESSSIINTSALKINKKTSKMKDR